MLRHRGTCDGDRAFQSLKNAQETLCLFSVRTTNGRATRGFSNFFFYFILFGCAAVFFLTILN